MDLTIRNAVIFDGHSLREEDTLVIEDGVLTAWGRDLAPGPGHEVVDAAGGLVTPGFVDAHAHPAMAGLERLGLDLSPCTSLPEAMRLVRTALEDGDGWLTGGGWSMSDFPGGAPQAALLDELGAELGIDRPVVLVSADHHSAWANSRALQLAGVDSSTPAPLGGVIEREASGVPTGTLHESAMDLVMGIVPPEDLATMRAAILDSQEYLHGLGITGYNEAIVGSYAGHGDVHAAYAAMSAAGELTIEVTGSLWWPRDVTDVDAQVAEFLARTTDTAKYRTSNVKFMLDGIVESNTAALTEPYTCPCGGFGTSYFTREHLAASFAAVQAAGFDIHCHAIGDAAVTSALDAFETVRGAPAPRAPHHHVAHLQVVDPRDVPRFAALDVTANLQALWAHYDEQLVELNLPVLGPERSTWLYPFGDLARAGTHLAMGSDWPVSTPDPWAAIGVAVTRTHPTGARTEALLPEQALDLTTCLRAYTRGSADLLRTRAAGRLEPGAPADLALASTNPYDLDPARIFEVRNRLTIAGGALVHTS